MLRWLLGYKGRMGRALRSCVLFLSLVCCFSIGPAPVSQVVAMQQGVDPFAAIMAAFKAVWEALLKIGNLADQADFVKEIWDFLVTLKKLAEALLSALQVAAKAFVQGQWLAAILEKKLAQFKVNTIVNTEIAKMNGEIAAKNAEATTGALANVSVQMESASPVEDFQGKIVDQIQQLLDDMYRLPGLEGNGPAFALDHYNFRCAYKLASPIDGYPEECIDVTTGLEELPGRRLLTDADLTSHVFDGVVTLEYPVMKKGEEQHPDGTVREVYRPDPQNYNQKMWVAALGYCANLVGPRPTPMAPNKDGELSVKAKTQRRNFNQDIAAQSAPNAACAQMLAYYSRPTNAADDANGSFQKVREEGNKVCTTITSEHMNVFDDNFVKNVLGNCEKGLSPYQIDYIKQSTCLSASYQIAQVISGYAAKMYKTMESTVSCTSAWYAWQEKIDLMRTKLIGAVETQLRLKQEWKTY